MKQRQPHVPPRPLPRQRGFNLVEMLVAMVVAVFLLAGLFTVLQGTQDTSGEQTALAQLQDNERIAVSVVTDMVQSAGYFPITNPDGTVNSLPNVLVVDNPSFATAGQSIWGGANGTGGDMIQVRFATLPNDGVSSCLGRPAPAGNVLPFIYKNELQVDPVAKQLTCSDNNGVQAIPIVTGVQSMVILWGVNTTATTPNSNCPADTYLTSIQMTTNLQWTNVCTVDVTFTFTNPLATQKNQPVKGQPATVSFRKVIAVMSKAGVT
jgi:type IV pilus assembly protein PilW